MAVSCACASSAKVFASARRMIEAGLIDAADGRRRRFAVPDHAVRISLAAAVLGAPCRPFDVARDGISIGEAAAFALLERAAGSTTPARCCCSASASRATPITCRRRIPEGTGARRAMQAALAAARPGARRHRLHQPARHRHAEQRPRGEPGRDQRVRRDARPAVRPRAPPATRWARPARSRRSSARSALRNGFMPGGVHTHARRSRCSRRTTCVENRRQPAAARAEQFVRLRRRELQPDLRAGRMSLAAYVDGIGVLGPGLARLAGAAAVLSGRRAYCAGADGAAGAGAMLPPAERRRTGRVVKLALAVALEAARNGADVDPAALASVFSSSGGDGHNCHEIVRVARAPAARGIADALLQFGAQCGRPAIGASPPARRRLQRPVRLRREFRRRTARGHDAGGGRRRIAAAGRLRHGISASRCTPSGPIPDAFGVGAGAHAAARQRARCARIGLASRDRPGGRFADPRLEALRVLDTRGPLPAAAAAAGAQRAPARAVHRLSGRAASRIEVEPCALDRAWIESAHSASWPHVPARRGRSLGRRLHLLPRAAATAPPTIRCAPTGGWGSPAASSTPPRRWRCMALCCAAAAPAPLARERRHAACPRISRRAARRRVPCPASR